MRHLIAAAAIAGALAGASCAHAGAGESILRNRLDAAQSQQAIVQLSARRADQETVYALGVSQLVRALEKFSQGLHRYGWAGIENANWGVRGLQLPVPPRDTPDRLTYAAFRDLVTTFVDDLDAARATLARVTSNSVKLRIDLARVRLDLDADGVGDVALGDFISPPDVAPARGGRAGQTMFAFDRADAIWLQGYAQLIAAPLDFLLAHDFEELVNATFHIIFPRSGLPLQGDANTVIFGIVDGTFADLVEAAHLINWRVVAPERRVRVRERLIEVARLSRANWAAIRAERDNDREWLPHPGQTSPFADLQITDARIDGWLRFMDVWESVLNGEKLVPHWRFQNRGFDMRALFEGQENFDLVSILTGYGALPYVREGETVPAEDISALNAALGPNALLFMFWFN